MIYNTWNLEAALVAASFLNYSIFWSRLGFSSLTRYAHKWLLPRFKILWSRITKRIAQSICNPLSVLDPASRFCVSAKYRCDFHKIRKSRAGGIFLYFVDPTGFEPVTSSLQMRRSTN